MHQDPPHLRQLACCKSEPECVLCPLLPQNAHLSLKELAWAGLKANLDKAGLDAEAELRRVPEASR